MMNSFNRFIENIKLLKDKYKVETPLYLIPKAIRDFRLMLSPCYPFPKDRHIIWLKTPKTAGSSVQQCLEDAGYLYMMIPYKRAITGVYSGRIEEFKLNYPEYWDTAWKFSFVRNPYDRFVSGWKYLRVTQDRSLKDVLLSLPDKEPRFGDWTHLTQPQSDRLYDNNNNMLVDKIVYYENLNDDLNQVLTHLGLPTVELPVVNKSRHREKGYINYFDEETCALLEKIYIDDFRNFKYQIERQ